VGEDDSLYVKVFSFKENMVLQPNRDFTLRKEAIALVKLYKFEGKVMDMFINEQQKNV